MKNTEAEHERNWNNSEIKCKFEILKLKNGNFNNH